jgi:magnesium transporter
MEPLMEAAQAIAAIKRDAADKDVFYYVYITDQRNLLLGVVSLRDLILSPPDATLASIMTSRPVYVSLDASVDEVADMFVKYGLRALPVLDADRRLRGGLRRNAGSCGPVSEIAYPICLRHEIWKPPPGEY